MKDMMDYFGRSPKEDKSPDNPVKRNAVPEPPLTTDLDVECITSDEVSQSCIPNDKVELKLIDYVDIPNCSVTSKILKKKSKTSKHKIITDETLYTDQCSLETRKSKTKPRSRVKKKCKDEHVEEVNKSEVISESADCDNTAVNKTVKSPQGSMRRYLIPHSTSPDETSSDSKPKRDITDFFSPSKLLQMDIVHPTQSVNSIHLIQNHSRNIQSLPVIEEQIVKKNGTKTSQKRKSSSKKLKKKILEDLVDSSMVSSEDIPNVQSSRKTRRKLSLVRSSSNTSTANISSPLKGKEEGITQKEEVDELKPISLIPPCKEIFQLAKSPIACSMAHALNQILLRSPSTKSDDLIQSSESSFNCQVSKKRKFNSDGKQSVESTSNQLDSSNEVKVVNVSPDLKTPHSAKRLVEESSETSIGANESSGKSGDSICKVDTKRNSLMNYFSKMSKEEAMLSLEKVEMEVKVLVHSPPTTPSKKKKRRSINSLPGGTNAAVKKKGRSLKSDDVNAIKLIGVEEIKLPDTGVDEPASVGSFKLDSLPKASASNDNSTLKLGAETENHKNLKRKAIRRKTVSPTCNTVSSSELIESSASQISCSSPASVVDNAEKSCGKSSVQSWQMRVCLGSTSLPSLRGTLHEEESESEEMFLSQKKKKRKVNSKVTTESSKKISQFTLLDKTMASVVRTGTINSLDEKENVHKDVKIAPLFHKNSRDASKEPQDNLREPSKMRNAGPKRSKIGGLQQPEERRNANVTPVSNGKQKNEAEHESGDEEMFPVQRKTHHRTAALQSSEESENDEVQVLQNPEKSPEIIYDKVKHLGKKDTKIAPLFNLKARTEARQQFLQSGVPDQVKRLIETQRSFEDQICDLFPEESHIQQKDDNIVWNLPPVSLPLKYDQLVEFSPEFPKVSPGDFTGRVVTKEELEEILSKLCEGPRMGVMRELPFTLVKPFLRQIKSETPSFKVAKTFKALQRKFLEDKHSKAALNSMAFSKPGRKTASKRKLTEGTSTSSSTLLHSQVWTEKYKPSTSSDIVGNSESVRKLCKWLEAWRQAGEEISKQNHKDDAKRFKGKKKKEDDDFVVEDSSDEDVRNLPGSTAVLYGPTGCGKTSTVYAVAKDLGYKVLEINASEKRNGKIVLSKLSEATQSHQVQRTNSSEQGFHALFSMKPKSTQKKKKRNEKSKPKSNTESEDEKSKKMSLILFEDVDIVFEEEDDGFLGAVSNLISSSKRPVILTATDLRSPYLSRLLHNSCLFLQFSPARDLICVWLQLVSLLEGIHVAASAVKTLIALCDGDFRRTLLQMQLWVASGGNNLPMTSLPLSDFNSKKGNKKMLEEDAVFDDDAPSVEDIEELKIAESLVPLNSDCVGAILGRNDATPCPYPDGSEKDLPFLGIPFPLDIGLYWWNTPRVLHLPQISHQPLPPVKQITSSGKMNLLDDSFIECFCSDDEYYKDSDVTSACGSELKQEEQVDILTKVEKSADISSMEVQLPSPKSSCTQKEMKAITQQIVCTSIIDVISTISCLSETRNNIEPISRVSLVKDGLSLTKMNIDGPNFVLESTARDMCHWLGENTLDETRNRLLSKHPVLKTCDPSPCDYCLSMPSSKEREWRTAFSTTVDHLFAAIPLCMHLDNRALFMDYIPAFRTFCQLEQKRSELNTKRKNRFYHYFKSLGANLLEHELEFLLQTMLSSNK